MKANQLNNSHSTHLITVRTCWIVRRAAIATDANSSACFTSRPGWNAVIFRQVVASAISGACCCNRLEESLQEDVGRQGTDALQRKSHLEPTGRAADDCRFLPGVDLQTGQAESVLTRQLLVHKSRKTETWKSISLSYQLERIYDIINNLRRNNNYTMVGRMSCSRQMAQRTKSSNDWLAWRGCGFERSLVGSFSSLRVRERRTNLFNTPPRFLCLAASLSVTTRGILT